MTPREPETFAEALEGVTPLESWERDDYEALARRLASDRSGAAFGDKTELAIVACQLGAERDALIAQLAEATAQLRLQQWERA